MIFRVSSVEQSSPTRISRSASTCCPTTLARQSPMYRPWLYATTQTDTFKRFSGTFADFFQQIQNQSPGLEVNEKRRRGNQQRQGTQGKRGNDPRCQRPGDLPGQQHQRRGDRERRENIPEQPGRADFRQEFSMHDGRPEKQKEKVRGCPGHRRSHGAVIQGAEYHGGNQDEQAGEVAFNVQAEVAVRVLQQVAHRRRPHKAGSGGIPSEHLRGLRGGFGVARPRVQNLCGKRDHHAAETREHGDEQNRGLAIQMKQLFVLLLLRENDEAGENGLLKRRHDQDRAQRDRRRQDESPVFLHRQHVRQYQLVPLADRDPHAGQEREPPAETQRFLQRFPLKFADRAAGQRSPQRGSEQHDLRDGDDELEKEERQDRIRYPDQDRNHHHGSQRG